MSETVSTAAREAVRIADKHLPGANIEQRKALAIDIVTAIGICEAELVTTIVDKLTGGKKHG